VIEIIGDGGTTSCFKLIFMEIVGKDGGNTEVVASN